MKYSCFHISHYDGNYSTTGVTNTHLRVLKACGFGALPPTPLHKPADWVGAPFIYAYVCNRIKKGGEEKVGMNLIGSC